MSAPHVPLLCVAVVAASAIGLREAGRGSDERPSAKRATWQIRPVTGDPATLRFTIDRVPFTPYCETDGRNSVCLHVTVK